MVKEHSVQNLVTDNNASKSQNRLYTASLNMSTPVGYGQAASPAVTTRLSPYKIEQSPTRSNQKNKKVVQNHEELVQVTTSNPKNVKRKRNYDAAIMGSGKSSMTDPPASGSTFQTEDYQPRHLADMLGSDMIHFKSTYAQAQKHFTSPVVKRGNNMEFLSLNHSREQHVMDPLLFKA